MILINLKLFKSQNNFIPGVRIPWSKSKFVPHAISAWTAGNLPVMFPWWQHQVSDKYPKASNVHGSTAMPGFVLSLPQPWLLYNVIIYLWNECGRRNGIGFAPLHPLWPSDRSSLLTYTANFLSSFPVIPTIINSNQHLQTSCNTVDTDLSNPFNSW